MDWYNKAIQNLGLGRIDFSTGGVKVAFTSGYTPDAGDAGHGTFADVTATATLEGQATLTGVNWANRVLDADDVVVPDDGVGSATCLVLYYDDGVNTYLLGYTTTAPGLPYNMDGTDDNLVWNASGILKLGS